MNRRSTSLVAAMAAVTLVATPATANAANPAVPSALAGPNTLTALNPADLLELAQNPMGVVKAFNVTVGENPKTHDPITTNLPNAVFGDLVGLAAPGADWSAIPGTFEGYFGEIDNNLTKLYGQESPSATTLAADPGIPGVTDFLEVASLPIANANLLFQSMVVTTAWKTDEDGDYYVDKNGNPIASIGGDPVDVEECATLAECLDLYGVPAQQTNLPNAIFAAFVKLGGQGKFEALANTLTSYLSQAVQNLQRLPGDAWVLNGNAINAVLPTPIIPENSLPTTPDPNLTLPTEDDGASTSTLVALRSTEAAGPAAPDFSTALNLLGLPLTLANTAMDAIVVDTGYKRPDKTSMFANLPSAIFATLVKNGATLQFDQLASDLSSYFTQFSEKVSALPTALQTDITDALGTAPEETSESSSGAQLQTLAVQNEPAPTGRHRATGQHRLVEDSSGGAPGRNALAGTATRSFIPDNTIVPDSGKSTGSQSSVLETILFGGQGGDESKSQGDDESKSQDNAPANESHAEDDSNKDGGASTGESASSAPIEVESDKDSGADATGSGAEADGPSASGGATGGSTGLS